MDFDVLVFSTFTFKVNLNMQTLIKVMSGSKDYFLASVIFQFFQSHEGKFATGQFSTKTKLLVKFEPTKLL